MKLVDQTRQYWANVEKLMILRRQEPVQTWDEMKLKLKEKCLHVSYKQHLSMTASDVRQSTSDGVHHQV